MLCLVFLDRIFFKIYLFQDNIGFCLYQLKNFLYDLNHEKCKKKCFLSRGGTGAITKINLRAAYECLQVLCHYIAICSFVFFVGFSSTF